MKRAENIITCSECGRPLCRLTKPFSMGPDVIIHVFCVPCEILVELVSPVSTGFMISEN